ncbi:hypothetical protein [Bacteroides heparinolyticus]
MRVEYAGIRGRVIKVGGVLIKLNFTCHPFKYRDAVSIFPLTVS